MPLVLQEVFYFKYGIFAPFKLRYLSGGVTRIPCDSHVKIQLILYYAQWFFP